MSWLKTFSLSLKVICAAVETLCQFGRSEDIKQTQVWPPFLHRMLASNIPAGGSHGSMWGQSRVYTFDKACCFCHIIHWYVFGFFYGLGFSQRALWWTGVSVRDVSGQHHPDKEWDWELERGADGESKAVTAFCFPVTSSLVWQMNRKLKVWLLCKTNSWILETYEAKEFTCDIKWCSLYKHNHKPKKRLLFPSRGAGEGRIDLPICLWFGDFCAFVRYF